jgi:hypothetical protein
MKAVPEVEIAEADTTAAGLPSQQEETAADAAKAKNKIPLETAYSEDDEELAGMSADASAAPQKPKAKPEEAEQVAEAPDGVTQGYPVPRPRPKPIEVLMMAAVNMKIEPASAPPPDQMAPTKAAPLEGNAIGVVPAPGSLIEESQSNVAEKTSLAEQLRDGDSDEVPVIRSITTASAGGDIFWWPQQVIFDPDKAVRRDGAAQQFTDTPLSDLLPGVSAAQAATAEPQHLATTVMPSAADDGEDMQVVNREGKGSLLSFPPLRKTVQNQN